MSLVKQVSGEFDLKGSSKPTKLEQSAWNGYW